MGQFGIIRIPADLIALPGHRLVRVFVDQELAPPMLSFVFEGPDMPDVPSGAVIPVIEGEVH